MGVIWNAPLAAFVKAFHDLLPTGRAWSREADRRHSRAITGLSAECVRIQNRGNALLDEADPSTALQSLDDWERIMGLPEFGYIPSTTAARRSVICGKLAAQGGQSRAYFLSVIEAMGVADADILDNPITFMWTVYLPSNIGMARAGDPCDVPLDSFDDTAIRVRLALEKYKPAHSFIYWTGDAPLE